MTDTTIRLSDETKARLDKRKTDSESYDEAVSRILDDSGVLFEESEIRALAREEVEQAVREMGHTSV